MYERTYHKTVLKTDEKQAKRKSRSNWRLIVRVVIAIAIITGITILTRLPRLQVSTVEVVGANVADPGDISEFVKEQLQGHRLFIFPKSSIFLVPEHSLEKNIKHAFSRFQTVVVSRKNFSTVLVSVTEYQGMYLWCTADTDCYFMDQNGIAFAPAPYFTGSAYPKIFVGTIQNVPFQAVTDDQISMITLLTDRLSAIGIVPEELHFVSEHELDVNFNHNGHQAQLIFDPVNSISDALVDLYTGLRTNPLASKFHDQNDVLQYIDLRFSNRVVYKFQ